MTDLLTKMLIKILKVRPIKKMVYRAFAHRFVAGENMEDALREAEEANRKGCTAIINYLGERAKTLEEVNRNTNIYMHLAREISARGLNARGTIKPTQLGLEFDENLYFKKLLQIGIIYDLHKIPLEIDMAEYEEINNTIENSIRLKQQLPNLRLRQCLQIAVERSAKDIKKLTDAGVHIRLCKGAHKIPPSAALLPKDYIPSRIIVYANCTFPKLTEVATHDMEVINMLKDEIGIQFLKGFCEKEISPLQSSGHPVAVYVPFGPEWVPYGVRRLFYLIKNRNKIFE